MHDGARIEVLTMYRLSRRTRRLGWVVAAGALLNLASASCALAFPWRESFDGRLSAIGRSIARHPLVSPSADGGVGGSGAIRVSYQGYERGSRRVQVRLPIPQPAKSYQLSFAVRFCDGFDFAKGGKLHGLGPKHPVTGGNPVSPHGWSARLMFREGGGLKTYVYHQDMPGPYGQSQVARGFRFVPGRFYNISMRVTLNDPATARNGSVEVLVDGVPLIRHDGLRLRASEGPDGMIQTVLFSTFHGGNSAEWAPRNTGTGTFKEDCAYFDDWAVDL